MYFFELIGTLKSSALIKNAEKVIIIILLITTSFAVRSQPYNFKKISFREGLPASNVYDILNDSKGYIWFATDNGVTRYDGFEFENFTTANGLPFNSTLILYEDYLERIWFLSYSGALSYYEDGEIIQYQCNQTIKNNLMNSYIDWMHIDSSNRIWLAPRIGGQFMIDSACNFKEFFKFPKKAGTCHIFFYDMGDKHFITIISDSNNIKFNPSGLTSCPRKYFIRTKYVKGNFLRKYLKISKDNYLIGYGNQLFHIKDNKILDKKTFHDPITCLTMDNDSNIWLSKEYGGGISMYPDADIQREPIRYFDGFTVTKVFQDRENNYWFATSGNGVFFTPTIDFNIYPFYEFDKSGMNVIALENYQNTVFFSSSNQDLYKGKIHKDQINSIERIPVPGIKNWIFNILTEDNGTLWLSNTKYLKYYQDGSHDSTIDSPGAFELAKGKDGKIYAGYNGFSIIQDEKVVYNSYNIFDIRVYAMEEDDNDYLWLGTLHGLYKYKDSTIISLKEMDERLGSRINNIVAFKDHVLVGTGSAGLLFIRGDSVRYQLKRNNHLPSDVVREICVYDDSTIWLAMNNGLVRLVVDVKDNFTFKTNWISVDGGLPTPEIHDINAIGDYIWLATNVGLVSFKEQDIRSSNIPPLIKISDIHVDGKSTPVNDPMVLGEGYKNIRIFYKGISFKGPESINYRYQLAPFNNEMIYTNNNFVDFPNLPPGDYTFNVNASYPNGKWHEKPQRIHFKIEKRFVDTIWFRILRVFIGIVLLLLVIRSIIWYFKRREKSRKKLIRLEQRFFRSQLNPHFIFNSLMAIQGVIYQQETKDAVRYLSSFAKLIRYIITIADLELVPLEKEIMFIRNFMELQKLRFKDKFDYEINIDPDLNLENIQIPPMMAQPFLENAIEHGLQNKEGKGRIIFELKKQSHYINLTIEDDGIGREQAKRYQFKKRIREDYSSTKIITDRIILLNELMDKKANLSIEDLHDENGKATGTKVLITIPIIVV